MRRISFPFLATAVVLLAVLRSFSGNSNLGAKEKSQTILPNDSTYRLYNLLDTSYAGKLSDFYILADIYKDPSHSDEEYQHVLRAEYDKSRFFGRFRIYVRSISKPTPEQLKAYTPKQLFDFGSDSEKFQKIDAGPFGQKGDLYLRTEDDKPLTTAPVTPQVQAAYESYLTRYLIPALEKK